MGRELFFLWYFFALAVQRGKRRKSETERERETLCPYLFLIRPNNMCFPLLSYLPIYWYIYIYVYSRDFLVSISPEVELAGATGVGLKEDDFWHTEAIASAGVWSRWSTGVLLGCDAFVYRPTVWTWVESEKLVVSENWYRLAWLMLRVQMTHFTRMVVVDYYYRVE